MSFCWLGDISVQPMEPGLRQCIPDLPARVGDFDPGPVKKIHQVCDRVYIYIYIFVYLYIYTYRYIINIYSYHDS